ncbi:MAG: hypothetical protein P4N41_22695 [Negativicutes bacterium]|nr:hypothetical protein [Negativicutes bacterium]
MEQPYSINVDLPPALYGEAALYANARGRTLNELIVEALESLLHTAEGDCVYPECPGPAPEWDSHFYKRH